MNSDVILKTRTKIVLDSKSQDNSWFRKKQTTPCDGFLYENKTQESANVDERREYCLTPVEVSLEDDGTEGRFIFPMQSFLLPVSVSSRLLRPTARVSQEAGWLFTGVS